MSDVVRVPFHGEDVLVADVDGKPHIVLRPAVEAIGLDYASQYTKLKSRSWAVVGQSTTTGADGKRYNMVTVDVRTFLMLLATIDENRVGVDVKPRLVLYQAEIADAIEQYWTRGVAVNPRLDHKEAAEVIAIFAQAKVGDPGYWDAKARQLTGRMLGESPQYDPATRPLTVSVYLTGRGVTSSALSSLAPKFGKALKRLYIERYGAPPPVMDDLVNRHMVPVAQYQETHRPLMDEIWATLQSKAA